MFLKFIVCLLAGLGAGVGTGLAGLSAAAVISPMLITFLGMNAFDAIGIALASDVLASGVSAYTYGKNKNLDIKNGKYILISVLIFTVIGSYISSLVPSHTMGGFSVAITIILGIKFIVKPVMKIESNSDSSKSIDISTDDIATSIEISSYNIQKEENLRKVKSFIAGIPIGFICGFIGAGGGMMMLIIMTTVLRYELKMAVGTSVFVMTFTALTGAISHFSISGGLPDLLSLFLCVVFTLIGAQGAAKFANSASSEKQNKITGYVLLGLGILMAISSIL
ncbi:MAG: sulfite exporter TauE/SafE family protein [Romboutsia sp.]|nr:sulfite exporter TauE/SafE family protein [Romboutsia sp.]